MATVGFLIWTITVASRLDGVMENSVTPLGSDFINLWATAKLVLSGAVETIYDPERFMLYERNFAHANVGFRLWVYPPTSLLFAWPIGLLDYVPAFVVWSLSGLAFLAWCARKAGFDARETAILVCSPAGFACIVHGQTGNLFTGLLLLALRPQSSRNWRSALATAALTIKPQFGFLLPVLWARERRWSMIVAAAASSLALMAVSLVVFGPEAWSDYFGRVAPTLAAYERLGTGPYMAMYPSVFMSLRILGMEGGHALLLHVLFASSIAFFYVWRLWHLQSTDAQIILTLVTTCLITPYLHLYDLSLLLAGGLLLLKSEPMNGGRRYYLCAIACTLTWLAPNLVPVLASIGVPVTPLVLTMLLLVVRDPSESRLAPGIPAFLPRAR